MLKVTYICQSRTFDELCLLEHPGGIRRKAEEYWKRYAKSDATAVPSTVDEALLLTDTLKVPERIQVWTNKTFPEVTHREY